MPQITKIPLGPRAPGCGRRGGDAFGQHQRSTKCCSNSDVLDSRCRAKDNGYERDDALGEGSSKRRQHGADRVLCNPELAADPLDAVDEELAADVDQRCRPDQQQNRKDQLVDSSIAISASKIEGAGVPEFLDLLRPRACKDERPKVWLGTHARADGTRAVNPVC
jgi:hypothetical protein